MCGFSLPDLCHGFPADINPTIAFLSNSFVQTTSCIAYIPIAHTFQFDIKKNKKFSQSNPLLAQTNHRKTHQKVTHVESEYFVSQHWKCHFWSNKFVQFPKSVKFWAFQKWHFRCQDAKSETTFISPKLDWTFCHFKSENTCGPGHLTQVYSLKIDITEPKHGACINGRKDQWCSPPTRRNQT